MTSIDSHRSPTGSYHNAGGKGELLHHHSGTIPKVTENLAPGLRRSNDFFSGIFFRGIIVPGKNRDIAGVAKTALAAAVLIGAVGISPAHAQTEEPVTQVCGVFGGEASVEGLQTVYAGCWGTGIVLGEAEQFEAFPNVELGATAIRLERFGRTRIVVIRARPDGQPIVEDMASVLADAAGRTPLGSTDGLVVDLSTFAENGMIGVSEAGIGGEEPLAGRGTAQGQSVTLTTAQVDVGAFIQNDPMSAQALSDR